MLSDRASFAISWLKIAGEFLAFCAVFSLWASNGHATDVQELTDFYERQMQSFQRALNDPTVNDRVFTIWEELVEYSGQMYPVFPNQTFSAGQALPSGAILLDVAIAGYEDVEVTAFWLAHEYAHQVMGHPRLQVALVGSWMAAQSTRRREDQADVWAARFMLKYDYPIEPVLDFLCEMPVVEFDTHSPGPDRAKQVAKAYGYDDIGDVPCLSEEGLRLTFQMWSTSIGNPSSFDFYVDDEYVASLDNRSGQLSCELAGVASGNHTYGMSNVSVYDPYGRPIIQGYECSGTFEVSRDKRLKIEASIPSPNVLVCRVH